MSVELHAIDTGGEGTPLVVVHGLMGSADNWRSHVKQWHRKRRVVAVDLRNHGRSPHAPGMRYAEMAGDLLACLDRLGIQRCHLLGHSMGGKVVMTLARQHPERVASLIVADIAAVRYGHGHDEIFAALHHVEAHTPSNRREVDALLAEHIEEKGTRLFLATNLERDSDGRLGWRLGLEHIEAGYDAIRDLPDGEGAYAGPSLILRGSRSSYVTDEMLSGLRELLPRAEVVTLEAGHWLHAEAPTEFQAAVNDFIAALED
ncbi:alpha/beta fold hydrolase [Halomonas sp. ML-15]|uniref:alpha/beta fold hydrolase n=1 Tax=Halomonas sp. ML-15 TaxID=2773305 RepID=UPI001745EBBB|nr:alpha/beta fold hydrolase [Halomonas sp. ML-15]MBD3894269.1 alpha/beta fold hydrolase [Halomonas sp. ML-15]